MKQSSTYLNLTLIKRLCIQGSVLMVLFVAQINNANSNSNINGGIFLNCALSGNGYGGIYETGLTLSKKRTAVSFYGSIQKSDLKLKGGGILAEYILFNCSEDSEFENKRSTDVYLFSSATYYSGCKLGRNQLALEQRAGKYPESDLSALSFNSIDLAVGIGFKRFFGENLHINFAVGYGAYLTTQGERRLFRDWVSDCATVKAGIGFRF